MYEGTTIFSQMMQHLPWHHLRRCVARYRGDYKVKEFRCTDHFRVMTFAQILIPEARRLYAGEDFGVDLDATVYALDSTTIDLCLSMFPWARFRKTKGTVKLHALLNLNGSIPGFIHISDGKLHDVNVLDYLLPDPGAYYIMDRGYLDFERLYEIHTCKAFFVTRAQSNPALARRYSRPVGRATGIICDQTVVLTNFHPKKDYPEPLRRIKFHDPEDVDSRLVFLTNDFTSQRSEPLLTGENPHKSGVSGVGLHKRRQGRS